MVSLTLSANFFGISIERDIWILATTFLTSLCGAIWGPLNETFRAKFIFVKEEEGEEIALKRTGSLIGFMIITTIILSIIISFSSNFIGKKLMDDPLQEDLGLFTSILLLILPTFLINQTTTIGISLLNSFEIYYIPEVIGTLTGLIGVSIIYFLSPIIGIYSLAISQYISIIFLFIAIIYHINKIIPQIWEYILKIKWNLIKDFILYSLPFFFPYFIGQCNTLGEKWLAGKLGQGIISSLDYSRQFTIVLQSVLSSVLTTVMVPTLSRFFSNKDYIGFKKSFEEYIRICFLILALIIPILIGAANPICRFFFLKGEMTLDSLKPIITLTQLFSIAFIGVILYIIFGIVLISSAQNKRYATWGVITQIIVLLLNLTFYKMLSFYVFPLTTILGHLFAAIIMGKYIPINTSAIVLKFTQYISIITIFTILFYFFNLHIQIESAFLQLIYNLVLLLFMLPFILKGFNYQIKPILNKIKKW